MKLFNVVTEDESLMQDPDVRAWLEQIEQRLTETLESAVSSIVMRGSGVKVIPACSGCCCEEETQC